MSEATDPNRVQNFTLDSAREQVMTDFHQVCVDFGQATHGHSTHRSHLWNLEYAILSKVKSDNDVRIRGILRQLNKTLIEKTGVGFTPEDVVSADKDGKRPFIGFLHSPDVLDALIWECWQPRDDEGCHIRDVSPTWFTAGHLQETYLFDLHSKDVKEIPLWKSLLQDSDKYPKIVGAVLDPQRWAGNLDDLYEIYKAFDASLHTDEFIYGEAEKALKQLFAVANGERDTHEKIKSTLVGLRFGSRSAHITFEGRNEWNRRAKEVIDFMGGFDKPTGFKERLAKEKAAALDGLEVNKA